MISSCFDWKQSARANGWTKKSDVELVEALVSCLLTKQIMTSNEDAETGYKPLKRLSPTPLYYPLIADFLCHTVRV